MLVFLILLDCKKTVLWSYGPSKHQSELVYLVLDMSPPPLNPAVLSPALFPDCSFMLGRSLCVSAAASNTQRNHCITAVLILLDLKYILQQALLDITE